MRLIDADKYQKELLSAYDDVSMEFEVLDRQPLVSAIPIPEGATNGDMIKAMFPNTEIEGIGGLEGLQCVAVSIGLGTSYFALDWWNAPYKGNLSEKPTGSESEEE